MFGEVANKFSSLGESVGDVPGEFEGVDVAKFNVGVEFLTNLCDTGDLDHVFIGLNAAVLAASTSQVNLYNYFLLIHCAMFLHRLYGLRYSYNNYS